MQGTPFLLFICVEFKVLLKNASLNIHVSTITSQHPCCDINSCHVERSKELYVKVTGKERNQSDAHVELDAKGITDRFL